MCKNVIFKAVLFNFLSFMLAGFQAILSRRGGVEFAPLSVLGEDSTRLQLFTLANRRLRLAAMEGDAAAI